MSSEGRRLVGVARFVIGLREVLLKCDPARAASWKPLAELLATAEAVQPVEAHPEVADAAAELADMRLLTEERLMEALVIGRSRRVLGKDAWSHEGLNPDALQAALDELHDFPRNSTPPPLAIARLADVAKLAVAVRSKLVHCSSKAAKSWQPLLVVLDEMAGEGSSLQDTDEAQTARRETDEAFRYMERSMSSILATGAFREDGRWSLQDVPPELALAVTNLRDLPLPTKESQHLLTQATPVLAVYDALMASRWTAAYDECEEAKKAGTWMQDKIGAAGLKKCVTDLHALHDPEPAVNRFGKLSSRLIELAEQVVDLAASLKQVNAAKVETWATLADLLRSDVAMKLEDLDGMRKSAQHEFLNVVCVSAVTSVGKELAKGGPARLPGLRAWSNGRTDGLQGALDHLRKLTGQIQFPGMGANSGTEQEELAQLIIDVRTTSAKCDWAKAASWKAVADLLDAPIAQRCGSGTVRAAGAEAAEAEIALIKEMLGDMRSKTEQEVCSQLSRDRSSEPAHGGKEWSHSGIRTAELQAALDELAAFPRMADEGRRLVGVARFVIGLREVLLKCDPARAASWKPLAELLATAEAVQLVEAHPEVADAAAELADMRLLTEERLMEALVMGQATKAANTKFYAHEAITTEHLIKARQSLDVFFHLPQGVGARAQRLHEEAGFAVQLRDILKTTRAGGPAKARDHDTWQPLVELLAGDAGRKQTARMDEAQHAWANLLLRWAFTFRSTKVRKELGLNIDLARILPKPVYDDMVPESVYKKVFAAPGCCAGVLLDDGQLAAAEQQRVRQERSAEEKAAREAAAEVARLRDDARARAAASTSGSTIAPQGAKGRAGRDADLKA